jgi:hypothetical protein
LLFWGLKRKILVKREREERERYTRKKNKHAQNTASAHIDAEFENFIIERNTRARLGGTSGD